MILFMILRSLYRTGEQLRRPSFLFRLVSAGTIVLFFIFLLDYALNIILQTHAFYTTADVGNAMIWFGGMTLTALLYRGYVVFKDDWEVTEVMNFAAVAVRFGNYFRERDVDTQERIGDHRMRTIYAEVTGTPFREELLRTEFDQPKKRTDSQPDVTPSVDPGVKPPPEYGNEMASLRRGAVTDVSVSFRFGLMGNRAHPFLPLMDRFIIDPVQHQLSASVLFPPEQTVPFGNPADKDRLLGHLYVALQVVIALPWFRFYERHAPVIILTAVQQSFDDAMTVRERPLLRFGILLERLRGRGTRITTANDLRTLASITYY
ncbi:MAG: hypothetical protein HUU02_07840 [Bacteroidetes bacterium]|nr:hypothetical protein [Bacteroidota bacterium]